MNAVVDLGTIELDEAARILHAHKETVRLKAKAGEIPARKVGKRWIFSSFALQRYLMGEWIPRVVQGDIAKEATTCHSSNVVQVRTGITSSIRPTAENQYREALAPRTKPKRRNSTTA